MDLNKDILNFKVIKVIQDKFKNWKHITKLDPDREHTLPLIEQVLLSGTDAIIIGGTQGITAQKTARLLQMTRTVVGSLLPICIEISHLETIQPGADGYFVPVVLNAGSVEWLIGAHQKALTSFSFILEHLNIDLNKLLIPEGYIILNPYSAAAQKTAANTELTAVDIISYCLLAQYLFKLPIIYIEYSGKLGSLDIVSQIKRHTKGTRLFYGGGITTPEAAYDFAQYADTIVVGNVVYQQPELLKSIVEAAKT